jgi:hypothetical protein
MGDNRLNMLRVEHGEHIPSLATCEAATGV